MKFAEGYDMSLRFNMDGLGVLYIMVATVWTLSLVIGSVFLIRNRRLPYLRMRRISLSIGGVATLHVYLVLCLTAYILNGNFPCATEFWIMSIYLPLGIALYHAANTQLLHVAMLQKNFAPHESAALQKDARKPTWRIIRDTLAEYGPTRRTMSLIGIGMAVQVSTTMPKRCRLTCPSSLLLSSSLPFPRSFMRAMASWNGPTNPSTIVSQPLNVEEAGNGGHQLHGNSLGHGFTLPIFYTKSRTFPTLMVGASKPCAVALLGKHFPE
jgi:hypothetical protein